MVHPTHARREFGDTANVRFGPIVAVDGATMTIRLDGDPTRWEAADADRLAAILGRDDLTRRDGHPVAMLNVERASLVAIAVGPAILPGRLEVAFGVFSLAEESLPGPSPDQPDWHLVRATAI
ncbi:MAG: hypothetical protein R3290_10200 [Acidimicrobiia bacterium]|nr:hypothetical protein [Acidimicrobiia bacterium]